MTRKQARFWTGGPEEQRKVLEEEMAAELAILQSKLEQATDPSETARVEAEIAQVQRRVAQQRKEIDHLLF